jgi:predicted metalloprotease with PDZ domain
MKLSRLLTLALLALPGVSFSQMSAEPLIAAGLIAPVKQCATNFEHMRPALDGAFEIFVRKNDRFFSPEMWRSLASFPWPSTKSHSAAECQAYLMELPALDADRILELSRKETACMQEASELFERLGSQRPRVGITFFSTPRTTVIESVEPDSPAKRAGLRSGDSVRSVGTTSVDTQCEVALAIMRLSPAKATEFSILREGDLYKIAILPIVESR